MLYLIAEQLGFPGILNLIRYLSFRAGGAVATALFLGLIIGPKFIGWLRLRQGKGQPIRDDGPQSHLAKRGTPTMGGLMILTAFTVSLLLWMDPRNPYVWACLAVTLGFGAIGFLDDWDKVRKATTAGVPGRVRLLLEFLIAGVAAWLIVRHNGTHLWLPFVAQPVADIGWFYVIFAAFTIVAFGNAVNLTDGLDGLATMPVIIASVAFMVITYLVGNAKFAAYLGIPGGFDGFRSRIVELCSELGIPNGLAAMGVEADRLDELTEMALEDPSCGGNPIAMTAQNTRALFQAAM